MKPKVMVSYSRQQTPFVDALYRDLVKAGYEDVWLDFQRLVPSAPWFDQIKAGIENAETILLVVSADSMSSPNVKDEWQMALEKKRIILLLFEATPIENPKLKQCEWVDFRTDYKAGLKQLDAMLTRAPQPENQRVPVPESGFKATKLFWFTFALSIFLVLASLPVAWTIFFPYILFPLPKQIYQRNYSFSRVVPALLLLPLFFGFNLFIIKAEGNILNLLPDIVYTVGGIAAFSGWLLAALLFTRTMQLRARPEAARIRSTNRNKAKPIEGKSVKFFIDYAPEDGRYADDLRRGLEKYGHQYVEDGVKPEAVFVLLSAYKKNTTYQAGQGLSLFPVILQATEVDQSLGKLQWLDFRRGISSANLKKIAHLLPQPTELVKVLAVPPTGRLEIFPLVVNALQYFYLVTGILAGGSLLTSLLSLSHLMFLGKLQADYFIKLSIGVLYGVLLFGAVLYSLRGIRSRASGAASAYPLFALFLFQGLMHLFIFGALSVDTTTSVATLADVAVNTTFFSILIFGVGFVSLLPFLLFRWKDLYRWLPRTFTKGDWLENTFLLYSPDGFGKTIIHVLFHSALFLVLFLITMSISNRAPVPSAIIGFPVVLVIFFHWLARRKPKKA